MLGGGIIDLGDGIAQTQSLRLSGDGTASLGGGIAQTQSPKRLYHHTTRWYRLVLVLQAVVLPSIGGGIARTRETWDEIFFGSNFKVI